MLLIDVTECLSTELDDVIDRIRDFSEDLYRCLANLTARNPRVDSVLKIPEISGVESISSSAYWRDFVLWSCLGALAPQ